MQVSFAHANLSEGNESTLLRFEDSALDQTPCVLIDAGPGVDVDSMLEGDEFLAGILLTHAHRDHYLSLGHNLLDDAAVYASPGTASVLDKALADGSQFDYLGDTDGVIDRLETVDSWERIHEVLRVHPLPAGHAPGASGFVVQFMDDDWRTIVVTGDFTLTRSAGYPEFPDDLLIDVEALVLTGSSSGRDDRQEMLWRSVERSVAGSCVLLTATGLSCVEYAYLLGHLCERLNYDPDIRVVGQAAKLYKRLGYDVPNVDSITEFDQVGEVLSDGGITLAGPQSPTEGASGRLFHSIEDDGGATLVQMTDGGVETIDSAGCTTYTFNHVAHPTEAEIDELVRTYDPATIIVTHQVGDDLDRYKDKYASFVWATEDDYSHAIYDEQWLSPPWVTDSGKSVVRLNNDRNGLQQQVVGEMPLPSLDRMADVDFEAEGVDIAAFDALEQDIATEQPTNGH